MGSAGNARGGAGGVSHTRTEITILSDDERTIRQFEWLRIGLAAIMLPLCVAMGYGYVTRKPDPPLLAVPVRSPPYRVIEGCPVRSYGGLDDVPRACLASQYHIAHPERYGLTGEYKSYVWYRIGDDAYQMSCHSWEPCTVFEWQRGFFRR